jgi:putative endonuclease
VNNAIVREKQIKAGSGKKKEELINKMNPKWEDLSEEIRIECN